MTKRTYIANNNKQHLLQNAAKEAVNENGYLNNTTSLNVQSILPLCDGFSTAHDAFENGSEEVRQLLLHECKLIYECHICSNMFRSIHDFLQHKRSICKNLRSVYNNVKKTSNVKTQTEHEVTCTPPVAPTAEENLEADKNYAKLNVQSEDSVVKKLNFDTKYPELHGLLFPKEIVMNENNNNNNNNVLNNASSDDNDAKNMQLVPVARNDDAIKLDSCKDNDINACNCDVSTADTEHSVHIPRCRFSSTYVFQCTQCPMVFVQPASAMKHLMKIHNRPRLGLRMLREAVLKRRIQLLAENTEQIEVREDGHCAYCKEVFKHSIDLSMHLLYCSVKDIVLQRRRVHFRHHSADYIRTAIEESKGEHLDPTIPLDFSELWPMSRQKLTKARQRIKQMEAKRCELLRKAANLQHTNNNVFKAGEIKDGKEATNSENMQITNKENAVESVAQNKLDKKKRKKEKRDKKERKRKQPTVDMVDSVPPTKPKKKQKESTGKDVDVARSIRKKAIQKLKVASLDESNSSNSSLISMESSENDLTANAAPVAQCKYNPCRCKICNKKFDGLGNVRRHISMFHYRANRFGCKLCTYRAFRRYDIVNHLGFVHKMSEERELMAVEYVVQHEIQTNMDVDDDIELLSINNNEEKPETANIKNTVGRPRKLINLEQNKSASSSGKKRRSKSKESDSLQRKRPIRNRIKPLEKDFVYDEDTKDAVPNIRCLRRRQSSLSNAKIDGAESKTAHVTNFIPLSLLGEDIMSQVKGAAARVLTTLVNGGLAAAASAPELPRERPIMRPHLSDLNRDGLQAGRVIETKELEQARLNSTLLDDTFLAAKINQIKKCSSNSNFRVKPSIAKEVVRGSVTRNLLLKVNGENLGDFIKQEYNGVGGSSINAQMDMFSTSNMNFGMLTPEQQVIKREYVDETEHENGLLENVVVPPPAAPHKRMRLFSENNEQQLAATEENSWSA